MQKIGPDGETFVRFLDEIAPKFNELQMAARAGMFPGMQEGIENLIPLLPKAQSIITEIATAVGDLSAQMGAGLSGAGFADFFDYLETDARPLLMEMGNTIGNFVEGLGAMVVAFSPLTDSFSGGFLKMSESFAAWAHGLDDNSSFQDFLNYVQQSGPKVLDLLGSLSELFVDLARAAAPVGDVMVPALAGFAEIIGDLAASPIGSLTIGLAAFVSTIGRLKALGSITTGGMFSGMRFRYRNQGHQGPRRHDG